MPRLFLSYHMTALRLRCPAFHHEQHFWHLSFARQLCVHRPHMHNPYPHYHTEEGRHVPGPALCFPAPNDSTFHGEQLLLLFIIKLPFLRHSARPWRTVVVAAVVALGTTGKPTCTALLTAWVAALGAPPLAETSINRAMTEVSRRVAVGRVSPSSHIPPPSSPSSISFTRVAPVRRLSRALFEMLNLNKTHTHSRMRRPSMRPWPPPQPRFFPRQLPPSLLLPHHQPRPHPCDGHASSPGDCPNVLPANRGRARDERRRDGARVGPHARGKEGRRREEGREPRKPATHNTHLPSLPHSLRSSNPWPRTGCCPPT